MRNAGTPHRLVVSFPIFGALMCAAAILEADTRIVTRSGMSPGEGADELPASVRESLAEQPTSTSTMWMGSDRSAMVDESSRMIARIDRGEIYILDPGTKSYTVVELEGEGDLSGTWEIEDTGETRQVGDWSTRLHHMTVEMVGQTIEIDLWLADIGVDLDGFRAFNEAVADALGADWMRAYAELDGYPVRQEVKVGGMVSWQEVDSVSEGDAPAGTYEVPAGWNRLDP